VATTAGSLDAAIHQLQKGIAQLQADTGLVVGAVGAAKATGARLQKTLAHLEYIMNATGTTGNYTLVLGPVEHVLETGRPVERVCKALAP